MTRICGRGIGTNIYYLHNNAYRVNGQGSFAILQSSGMPHLDSKGDPVTLLVGASLLHYLLLLEHLPSSIDLTSFFGASMAEIVREFISENR
jgi:hypothetical protein